MITSIYCALCYAFIIFHRLIVSGAETSQCIGMSDTLKWNRTINFDNRPLTLKLAVTHEPAHWVVNYLFQLLARERLGYKQIEFVQVNEHDIGDTIDQLRCPDTSCQILPRVHLNLLLWLPVGVDVGSWASPSTVSDHGPLGPTRQWKLTTQSEFVKKKDRFTGSSVTCSQQSSISVENISSLIHKQARWNDSAILAESRKQPVTMYEFRLNNSTLHSYSVAWSDPPVCEDHGSGVTNDQICRTESYQAVKVSWANLSTASPPLFNLASRMRLTTEEFTDLMKQVQKNIKALRMTVRSDARFQKVYQDTACLWLRMHQSKWKQWTEGWNQKLNLTVAAMFSVYGKWILPGLQEAAEVAIGFVNEDPDYFLDSEYALKLDVHNLSCQPGMVLSEYFKILAEAADSHLIGSIAALCSNAMEAMVELANLRKKLILSPTVATARFVEQQYFPYFFRTIPAMTEANYVLLRLFRLWGWRRVAVFRKRDHFFNPPLFRADKIEIIADFGVEENRLTYHSALDFLESVKQRNGRIFIIEYDARGTYIILCAAYHLGMHFHAGYVWFLNPWLSSNWWTQPALASFNDCTYEEMANITSWTFTVGHQWIIPQMLHSFTRLSIPRAFSPSDHEAVPPDNLSTTNSHANAVESHRVRLRRHVAHDAEPTGIHTSDGLSIGASPRPAQPSTYDPTEFYLAYTTDAVMALASALVNLLKENPSAVSALHHPAVAETFRHWVARTEFGYGGVTKTAADDTMSSKEDFFLGFGFQAAGEFYGLRQPGTGNSSRLRFNALNERIAGHWLLKQHRLNTTVPIFVWVANNLTVSELDPHHSHASRGQDRDPMTVANLHTDDLLADFFRFERQMHMLSMDRVNWSILAGPPHDGSMSSEEDCAFPFLSDTLRMGCTGATVFVAVTVTLISLIPIVLASLHYRRKLRETEKRTRKPFEELCAELADLDMPVETIVINRQIGQGAFGLVFGGEAKTSDCWEAVAVKVINEKATYEGKIDFLSEAKLMRMLKHPNVVRLIGISLSQKENLYLVMELMLLGDLKTYLLSRRILAQRSPDHDDIRPSTLTSMSMDIAQGVCYLHSQHLIHRDIACRNCLVGADHVVKIGDFGLTREATKNKPECYYRFTRNCELPIRWMSPEAVQYGIFSVQSDIWSYGITLYEIVTFGVFPYSDMGDVEVVERVKRMEFCIADFLPSSARNTVVCQLIKQCCQHQWKNRPSSMHQVLQVLTDYPECIRPLLTDDPPKPVCMNEPLPFQSILSNRIVPDAAVSDCAFPPDRLASGCLQTVHSTSASAMLATNLDGVEDGLYHFKEPASMSRINDACDHRETPDEPDTKPYNANRSGSSCFTSELPARTTPHHDSIRFHCPSVSPSSGRASDTEREPLLMPRASDKGDASCRRCSSTEVLLDPVVTSCL